MPARENFTFSDLENWLNERRVTEIECLVPDLTGVARGKILPREKFTEDRGMRLPEAIVAIGEGTREHAYARPRGNERERSRNAVCMDRPAGIRERAA